MKKPFLSVVCACAMAAAGCRTPSSPPDAMSEEEQIARTEALARQATCRVYVNGRFSGTGSLIREDLVITAAHLFEGGQLMPRPLPPEHAPIAVLFMPPDGSPNADKPYPEVFLGIPRLPASLVMLREEIDLALLAIKPTGRTPIRLADDCAVGEKIMAPSYKHGRELILPRAEIVEITEDGFVYNASAGGGSSGAPVVNLRGELVGLCKGAIEGGLKIMPANCRSIRRWFGEIEGALKEVGAGLPQRR